MPRVKGQEEKLEENEDLLERASLHIETSKIVAAEAGKSLKNAPIKTQNIQPGFSAAIAKKVASIDDALANSSGSREKPLV